VPPAPLPRAPADALGPTGPRLGAYAGPLGRADFSSLAPEGLLASLGFAARLRRWQEVFLVTPTHLLALSLHEAGPLASAGVWAVERARGEVRFDRTAAGVAGLSARVGPRPGAGARATFVGPGLSLTLERRSDRFQLEADLGDDLRLSARLDTRGAPEPFALVAPLPEGGVRAAQHTGPLTVEGRLSLRGEPVALEGALAALAFGAGAFTRAPAWRRLTAIGPVRPGAPGVLHLLEGLAAGPDDDCGEDALLAAGGPWRLPAVAFEAPEPDRPWRIGSRGGEVALEFAPAASHREAAPLRLGGETTRLAGELTGSVPGPDGAPLEVVRWPAVIEALVARG